MGAYKKVLPVLAMGAYKKVLAVLTKGRLSLVAALLLVSLLWGAYHMVLFCPYYEAPFFWLLCSFLILHKGTLSIRRKGQFQ